MTTQEKILHNLKSRGLGHNDAIDALDYASVNLVIDLSVCAHTLSQPHFGDILHQCDVYIGRWIGLYRPNKWYIINFPKLTINKYLIEH